MTQHVDIPAIKLGPTPATPATQGPVSFEPTGCMGIADCCVLTAMLRDTQNGALLRTCAAIAQPTLQEPLRAKSVLRFDQSLLITELTSVNDHYLVSITSENTPQTAQPVLCLTIPRECCGTEGIVIDDHPLILNDNLPWEFPQSSCIAIISGDKKVHICGALSIRAVRDFTGIRLELGAANGEPVTCTISVLLPSVHFADLSGYVNATFHDDGDGKGWMDNGPSYDLRSFPFGRPYLCGPFRLHENNDTTGSCIRLAGEKRPSYPTQVSIAVAEPVETSALRILHSGGWMADYPGEQIGTVEVCRTDGSSQQFAVIAGEDVGDWYNPVALVNAPLAWRDLHKSMVTRDEVGWYDRTIDLPTGAPVAEVRLLSHRKAVWMIAAVSLHKGLGEMSPWSGSVCYNLFSEVSLKRYHHFMFQYAHGPAIDTSGAKLPLKIAGTEYTDGIGATAPMELVLDCKRNALAFLAQVGIDDHAQEGASARLMLRLDNELVYDSGIMHKGDAARVVNADLRGGCELVLQIAHCAGAKSRVFVNLIGSTIRYITNAGAVAESASNECGFPAIAHTDCSLTKLTGPAVTGTTPGREFVFRMGATGTAPLEFSADGLPNGLTLDKNSGILSGRVIAEGTYQVSVSVRGPDGRDSRTLTIVAKPESLARTPPMGWNSWNIWGLRCSDYHIRNAAHHLIATGLADHGYQYVNIDDGWEADRDLSGCIRPNKHFPDMKKLADHIHQMGLRLGIYSSPGPKTCGGFEGSLGHELQDARTWAQWGIDYLKYDWCSCTNKDLKEPYALMRSCLDKVGRDIIFSLCQYGWAQVWKWGGSETGGNLWRTTGDITDTWASMASIGFDHTGREEFAGPGRWNDPDMLVVGMLGWGSVRPTLLSALEQQTHMSLWCLLAAPLLLGCHLDKLDNWTYDLLTNDEVLAIDQDPLGKAAKKIAETAAADGEVFGTQIWARPLHDRTLAVGIFNLGRGSREVTFTPAMVDRSGPLTLRDLWLKEDLGNFEEAFRCCVPGHGCRLLKLL